MSDLEAVWDCQPSYRARLILIAHTGVKCGPWRRTRLPMARSSSAAEQFCSFNATDCAQRACVCSSAMPEIRVCGGGGGRPRSACLRNCGKGIRALLFQCLILCGKLHATLGAVQQESCGVTSVVTSVKPQCCCFKVQQRRHVGYAVSCDV